MADTFSVQRNKSFWEFCCAVAPRVPVCAEPIDAFPQETRLSVVRLRSKGFSGGKMGNKQTIFTDEQLDAYQVSLAASAPCMLEITDVSV